MDNTSKTIAYYDEKAESFISGTRDVDFSSLQSEFVSRIQEGGRILDLGCGSGRDSKAFIDQGFNVVAVDGSPEICKIASEYIGQPVICSTFQDYEPEGMFDGIWACASLLHLDYTDIESVMRKLSEHLNDGGSFYVSFKYGDFSGERNGRFFTDLDEDHFQTILNLIPTLVIQRQYITSDVRAGRYEEKWLNVFLIKREANAPLVEAHNELVEQEDGAVSEFPKGKVLRVLPGNPDIDFNNALAKLTQYADIGRVLANIEKKVEYVVQIPLKYQKQFNEGEFFINKNSKTGVEWPALMRKAENGQYRFVDDLPIKQQEFIQGNPMRDISMNFYNLAMQRQLAALADAVQKTYKIVERIEHGQMDDRIALLLSGRKQILYSLSLKNEDDRRIGIANARKALSDAQNQIGLALKRRVEEFEPVPATRIGRFFSEVKHSGYLTEKDEEFYEIQDYYQFYLEATKLLASSYVVTGDTDAAEQVFLESASFLKSINFEPVKTIGYGSRKEEALDMFYSRPVTYLTTEQNQCMDNAKEYDYMTIEVTGERLLEVLSDGREEVSE